MRPSQFVPPLLVGVLGACLALVPCPLSGPWPLLLVGGAYAVAVLGGAAWVVLRRGERVGLVPRVALAFATLHLAYGAGFLVGLVRFADRWLERPVAHASAPGAA